MDSRREPAAQIFVVRVAHNEPYLPDDHWSATIVHVASGARRTIVSYDDLRGFIEERRARSSHD
jgi:hypothetical protein